MNEIIAPEEWSSDLWLTAGYIISAAHVKDIAGTFLERWKLSKSTAEITIRTHWQNPIYNNSSYSALPSLVLINSNCRIQMHTKHVAIGLRCSASITHAILHEKWDHAPEKEGKAEFLQRKQICSKVDVSELVSLSILVLFWYFSFIRKAILTHLPQTNELLSRILTYLKWRKQVCCIVKVRRVPKPHRHFSKSCFVCVVLTKNESPTGLERHQRE